MNVIKYFAVGNAITVELEADPSSAFRSVVQRVKGGLVAIKVPSSDVSSDDLQEKVILEMDIDKIGGGNVIISGVVLSNKAFPVVVLKPLDILADNTPQMGDLVEKQLNRYVDVYSQDQEQEYERDGARIENNFSVSYKPIAKELAEEIKGDYLLKPTHLRDREEVTGGINLMSLSKPINLDTISHIDPIIAETIKDIYARIDAIANVTNLYASGQETKDMDSLAALCNEISATGLRMTSWKPLDVGHIARIVVAPPKADVPFSVSLLGEVIWVKELKGAKDAPSKYSLGIKFIAINEQDRDEITRYTFKIQQEFLRLRKERETSESY